MVWMVLMCVLAFGAPLAVFSSGPIHHPQQLMLVLLPISVVLCFITAITLAGSGIQTALLRPGGSEKGGEGSTLFTLSLPVTRIRLFAVRTVIGVLETLALLTLFSFVIPRLAMNADVGLGYFAVIVSSSLAVYAISACISTFCDEGWRYRGSVVIVALLFVLATAGKVPRPINIFRGIGVPLPLVAQQIPWLAIATPCILALLFFGAALLIIRRRDY
jgi:hypothetical protein